METLFISDLHLSHERPEKLRLFKQLMQGRARTASAVYILGDLFEHFWVGHDDVTPPNAEILTELLEFCKTGTPCYVMRGNRDLLLDEHFSSSTGCRLLPDHAVIDLQGTRTLLMHGDLLCSRDNIYQRYRKIIDSAPVKGLFRKLPYQLRIHIAHRLRPIMKKSTRQKPREITDVDQATVEQTMQTYNVTQLIHGHTHRPGIHHFDLQGKPATRFVLGDWYDQEQLLVCRDGKPCLQPLAQYLSGEHS